MYKNAYMYVQKHFESLENDYNELKSDTKVILQACKEYKEKFETEKENSELLTKKLNEKEEVLNLKDKEISTMRSQLKDRENEINQLKKEKEQSEEAGMDFFDFSTAGF